MNEKSKAIVRRKLLHTIVNLTFTRLSFKNKIVITYWMLFKPYKICVFYRNIIIDIYAEEHILIKEPNKLFNKKIR